MTACPTSRVRYARPPIQEAVCEVHFASAKPLLPREIEHIKPVWKGEYPDQRVVAEKTIQVRLGVDKVDTDSTSTGHKLIARSEDGKDLAQLGPSFLAVNRLSPYVGWEESFRSTIERRAGEVVGCYAFEKIERVGLRYINHIKFPDAPLRWADWLAVALPVPCGLGEVGGTFQFHFEQRLSAGIQGIINFLGLPTQPGGTTSVILDIDVCWRGSEVPARLGDILEAVHSPHHDLFESYLLDKSRDLFEIMR